MIWLLACRSPSGAPHGTSPGTTGATGHTADSGDQRPVLASPPDAEDLDPADDVVHVELTAAPLAFEVGGVAVDGWAYGGRVPGPTLRVRLGQTLVVDLHNELPEPTTIHWHGVGVPAAMDGAGWPMPEIAPGASFTYTFAPRVAGTFWYHPHLDTDHQMDRGLYGVLVVEDPADPPADELVAVLDLFGEPEAAEHDPHLVDPHLTRWAVNGLVDPVFEGAGPVRVRLLNASNAGYVSLRDVVVVAHDQGLLAAPQDSVVLAPGDRADLEWRVGPGFALAAEPYSAAGGPAHGEEVQLVEVLGGGPAPAPLPFAFSGAPPSEDPGTTDVRLLMTGSPELGWELNGETFPDVTAPRLALGSDVVIEVRNASPSLHPFHTHGHAFEVLSVNGAPPAARTIEDTVDVPIAGVVRLRMTADNPGTWMVHCHILAHAEGGMMTLFEVQ